MAAAGVIADALIDIDPQYPTVSKEARAALQAARLELEAEAPAGGGDLSGQGRPLRTP